MKNLPLGFAMVLAAAILIERGWTMFGGSFDGGTATADAAVAPKVSPAPDHGALTGTRRLGFRLMTQRYPKWARDPRQWAALDWLWTRESGWNPHITNPSSGAAGIPQDITGNMHGGAAGQIIWGLRYIADRYGSPVEAKKHEEAIGWY